MAISGNLRTMHFPDLMQWIAMSRKTGTLVIKGAKFTKKVLFQGGTITAVTSNNPREHLGYYLVGWGYVTQAELGQLLEAQRQQNAMVGELLVRGGRLTREEVDYIVRVKTEETIFDLMQWEEGEFFFLDDALPRRDFKELDSPVDYYLFEGSRQIDEMRRIREVIPAASWVPMVVGTPAGGSDLLELAVLSNVDGKRDIEQVALASRSPIFAVFSVIYQGVKRGLYRVEEPAPAATAGPELQAVSWRDYLIEAENSIMLRDLLESYRQLCALREQYPGLAEAQAEADRVERQIEVELDAASLNATAILEWALAPDEIMRLKCSPEESFVLSRINGFYSLPQVLAQLPGNKLYNKLIVHNLIQRGVIKFRELQSVVRFKQQFP